MSELSDVPTNLQFRCFLDDMRLNPRTISPEDMLLTIQLDFDFVHYLKYFLMGSLYMNYWSCSGCDFKDGTVSGPFRVEPAEGTYKALIEERWCRDCNGIRRCFTGKGHEYTLSDLDYTPGHDLISEYRWKSISEVKAVVEELESKKGFFFSLSKKSRVLEYLKEQLVACQDTTNRAKKFYDDLNPNARCIICGSKNISDLRWDLDTHICGGTFSKTPSGRLGSVASYDFITYDEFGNSEVEKKGFYR